MNKSGIAIDLGGTKCAGALISSKGEIVSREIITISGYKGTDVADKIITLVRQLKSAAEKEGYQVTGMCVSVPGIAYEYSGNVWAPNIPGWENFPLKNILENSHEIDFKIHVDNDRACSILGEVWLGAARKCENAIFLAIGTGIGAGILSGGNIIRGHRDIAGAIGWLALDSEYKPGYKQFGSFEYNASGNGLVRVAQDQIERGGWDHTSLAKIKNFDSETIFKSYNSDDPLAKYVIKNAIEYWGKAVANLVSIFDPEIIIFGGGVFGPAINLLDDIFEEAKNWAQPVSIQHLRLLPSALGQEAVLYGAGKIALKI